MESKRLGQYAWNANYREESEKARSSGSVCGAPAGYEECGAVPDEDQAARLVREHVKLHIGPEGAGRIVRDHGKLL